MIMLGQLGEIGATKAAAQALYCTAAFIVFTSKNRRIREHKGAYERMRRGQQVPKTRFSGAKSTENRREARLPFGGRVWYTGITERRRATKGTRQAEVPGLPGPPWKGKRMNINFGSANAPQDNIPRYQEAGKKLGRRLLLVLLAAALVALGSASFTIIEEGYIGVKYQFGKIVDDSLSAGLNFKVPFVQTIRQVDVREQMYQMDANAYTKDTQTVEGIQTKLNYVYDRGELSNIIRNIGINNVESKLLIPQMQSIVKNEIGQYKAEDLVQNRTTVQESIEDKLRESLGQSGIIVVSFAIENLDFEDGFEEAIRAKVVAEQEALKMQNKTKEAEEKARQTVISAQAQADSQRIEAEAQAYSIQVVQEQLVNSPQYIEYEKIQKWNGQFPQAMGENINPFIALDGSGASSTGNQRSAAAPSTTPEE